MKVPPLSIIQWCRKRDNGLPRVHAISLSCGSRWILSGSVLCIIQPWGSHTLSPFPLWGFSGPTMETWGDPTTHHCTSQAEQLQSWGENICVLWTLETQWTQDTRPNPPQLFIDCLQKWSEKDLNSGWGISTDTHTLPNIVPLNNKKVNERQGQVPTSKMLIFVLQVCKASACVCVCAGLVLVFSCADKLEHDNVKTHCSGKKRRDIQCFSSSAIFTLLYFAAHPSSSTLGLIQNFPGNKIRFGRRRRLLVSCRYLQQFLSKCPLLTISNNPCQSWVPCGGAMNSAAVGDRLSLSGIDCLCPIFPLFVPLTDSSVPDWGRPAQKSTNLTGLHVWGFSMTKTDAFLFGS